MKPGILKRDSITEATAPKPALPASPEAHAPRAELVFDAGVARALRVTCACGESTLVELRYPNDDAEVRP